VSDQLRRRSVGAPATRSMLLTILGEYVLSRPGAWQETLVAALAAVGYKEQAARQAIARSVSEGWLATERHGRRARMLLSAETGSMLSEGAERIYRFGEPWTWDGRWLLVVLRVPEQRRAIRHQMRTQLAWAGFGSLGGGVWISPHVEREREVSSVGNSGTAAEMLSFEAELGAIGEPEKVIAEAWDLERVAGHYRAFLADFSAIRPRSPEAVFAAQTTIVHAWRKFPFLDPDLPQRLLPKRWPRERAHELFQDRHQRWHEQAQDYFSGLER
jgi:phenylacetic acid degradation operon negative regulatory protein